MIVDRLRDFVPAGVPCSLLEPGVDTDYFRTTQADPLRRQELGLAEGERVIVFTGSNTFANEPEMLELYRAVLLLNQRGIKTRLVRTGFNRPEFLASLTPQLAENVVDLGFIAKAALPGLLALADVLVQPGRPGPFNDYRLPSKLPEFLASGRPVVLPRSNVALGMTDGVEAVFLSSGTPEDIAGCCERIFGNPQLAASLGKNGAAYARKHFDLTTNAAGLLKTYEETLSRPARAHWEVVRSTSGSDVTVAAREVADALLPGRKGDARPADLAALAADLADFVRTEDARATGETAERDKVRLRLEETVRHLELHRNLSNQHAKNLKEKIELQDRHQKIHKKLTERHILNLEARTSAIERMARQKAERGGGRGLAGRKGLRGGRSGARSTRGPDHGTRRGAQRARPEAALHHRLVVVQARRPDPRP